MLRATIYAGIVLALLTGTALAQLPMPSISFHGDKRQLTPEEIARQKVLDQAYQAANKKIPDKQTADPWGNVRTAPAPTAKSKHR